MNEPDKVKVIWRGSVIAPSIMVDADLVQTHPPDLAAITVNLESFVMLMELQWKRDHPTERNA